ncbi:hypothetical protein LTR56_010006 [Elasticomyces elasticus]|nr:hypothetical protein LTR56_010006 [Elasticomyces elasticus]KAK3665056.1 hypothetical protein LTR22_004112 [Elasticomyces elasticus]KAK4931569.1 hypothetical protein LTR49_001957 [Elasticomyces elasticus]KAK5766729.1 hypothetical protein LTS12_003078 [Elasticomyces elasticus]
MAIQHTLQDLSCGSDRALTVNKRGEIAAMLDRNETDGTTIASDDDDEAEAKMRESRASSFRYQVPSCKQPGCVDRGGLHSKTVDHSTEQIVCPVQKTEHDLSEHLLNLKAQTNKEAKTYAEDSILQSRRKNKLREDQDAKTPCDRCSRCGPVSAWKGSSWPSLLRRQARQPPLGWGWCDTAAAGHLIYEGSDKKAGSEVARRRVRVASIPVRSRRSIMDMLLLLVKLAGILRPRSARCRLPFAVGQACTPDTGGMEKSLRPPGGRAY